MTIVIHCDASTKNGCSSWAYKVFGAINYNYGFINTANTCIAETTAVIKAIENNILYDQDIVIISDNFTAIDIIQRTNKKIDFVNGRCKKFKKVRDKLVMLVKCHNIDAIWISSNNSNEAHQEIDGIAKAVLNSYLAKELIHE